MSLSKTGRSGAASPMNDCKMEKQWLKTIEDILTSMKLEMSEKEGKLAELDPVVGDLQLYSTKLLYEEVKTSIAKTKPQLTKFESIVVDIKQLEERFDAIVNDFKCNLDVGAAFSEIKHPSNSGDITYALKRMRDEISLKESRIKKLENKISSFPSYSTKLLFGEVKTCVSKVKDQLSELDSYMNNCKILDKRFEAVVSDVTNQLNGKPLSNNSKVQMQGKPKQSGSILGTYMTSKGKNDYDGKLPSPEIKDDSVNHLTVRMNAGNDNEITSRILFRQDASTPVTLKSKLMEPDGLHNNNSLNNKESSTAGSAPKVQRLETPENNDSRPARKSKLDAMNAIKVATGGKRPPLVQQTSQLTTPIGAGTLRCPDCEKKFHDSAELREHYLVSHYTSEEDQASSISTADFLPGDDKEVKNKRSTSFGFAMATKNNPNKKPITAEKPGYLTCGICNATKYYARVITRFGQYSCEPCYRQFVKFLKKPVQLHCFNGGKCEITSNVESPISPGTSAAVTSCQACWLTRCFEKYVINHKLRDRILNSFAPKICDLKDQEYPAIHEENGNTQTSNSQLSESTSQEPVDVNSLVDGNLSSEADDIFSSDVNCIVCSCVFQYRASVGHNYLSELFGIFCCDLCDEFFTDCINSGDVQFTCEGDQNCDIDGAERCKACWLRKGLETFDLSKFTSDPPTIQSDQFGDMLAIEQNEEGPPILQANYASPRSVGLRRRKSDEKNGTLATTTRSKGEPSTYNCEFCPSRLSSKASLQYHYASCHPDNISTTDLPKRFVKVHKRCLERLRTEESSTS